MEINEPCQKPKWSLVLDSKRVEDIEMSDFSMYDDDIEPFIFSCARFVYRNKARIKLDEEIKVAMDDYRERSRNLSSFDAIGTPKIAGLCGGTGPLLITDDVRRRLIPLCKLALDKYNAENQGANFVFADIVKSTWSPTAGAMYYITFRAEDPSNNNSSLTTFQAQVWNKRPGPPDVKSCAIKT